MGRALGSLILSGRRGLDLSAHEADVASVREDLTDLPAERRRGLLANHSELTDTTSKRGSGGGPHEHGHAATRAKHCVRVTVYWAADGWFIAPMTDTVTESRGWL